MKKNLLQSLSVTGLDYIKVKGKSLAARYDNLYKLTNTLNDFGVYCFANRVLNTTVSPYVNAEVAKANAAKFLNFSSQDYLGLAQNEEVKNAAREVIDRFGVHVASSPILTGRNTLTEELECRLANILGMDQCLLFPTGWAACFGVISALVTEYDSLIIDALSHNSLQTGSRFSVRHVQKFRHNDLNHLENLLKKARIKNPDSGVFVVAEGLYSMHSDQPDLKNLIRLVNKYEGILILDIAHDFGALGKKGIGLLEEAEGEDLTNLVLCGSFSKSFASNGGFVAGPEVIRQQLVIFAPSYTFSNGISPMQSALALKCADIIFSEEGDRLRKKLKANIDFARSEFNKKGFTTIGTPSPIVPVFIGEEMLARLMTKELIKDGLLANLAEYPAVPKKKAIFRFQIMATHNSDQIPKAVEIMKTAHHEAKLNFKSMNTAVTENE